MDKFFKDKTVECIEDLDILMEKINSIRRLINNSDRYYNLKNTKYYFDNINRSDSWTILYKYIPIWKYSSYPKLPLLKLLEPSVPI